MIPESAIKRKETPRRVRVASEVKKVLSEFLLRGAVSDSERPSMATMIAITGVEMSADLQHAKVFFSSISPQTSSEECAEFLEKHKYKLRAHIGASIRLKHTPELRFLIDDSSEKAEKIENILKKIAPK